MLRSSVLNVHNKNRYIQSISDWPVSILSSSFSVSCWIWIPKYRYSLSFDLEPSESERVYLFVSPSRDLWCVYAHGMQFTGQCEIKSEEWIFVGVNCWNSSKCSLWLNCNEHTSESERTQFDNLSRRDETFVVRCYNGWEISRDALIVDLHLFPFCLFSYEIENLVKQKTSIDQMSMSDYILRKSDKINH